MGRATKSAARPLDENHGIARRNLLNTLGAGLAGGLISTTTTTLQAQAQQIEHVVDKHVVERSAQNISKLLVALLQKPSGPQDVGNRSHALWFLDFLQQSQKGSGGTRPMGQRTKSWDIRESCCCGRWVDLNRET